jgi:group I intron endonuclease
MQGIYTIKNNSTDQLYIGSAINIEKRFNSHKCKLRKNKHENSKLQYSWNKYGESNFHFQAEELVENKIDLIKYEQQWLDLLWDKEKLFNLRPIAGSQLGFKHSDKTKEKISQNRKGIKHSIQTIKKFSIQREGKNNAFYGKEHTEQTKQKMREARDISFSPFRGKKHTEEAKRKNALARLGKKRSETTKQRMIEAQKRRRLREKEVLHAI